jgi:hypothetical protein
MQPGATRRPGVSKLVWLMRQGVLGDLTSRASDWLLRHHQQHSRCNDAGVYLGCDLSTHSLRRSAFSNTLIDAYHESFDLDDVLDPAHLEEKLESWSWQTSEAILRDDDEFFIANWKYDREMRLSGIPLVSLLAHLESPVIIPATLSYEALINRIKAAIGPREVLSIRKLARRLDETNVTIDVDFLAALVRNEPRFQLFAKAEEELSVLASEDIFGWTLAAELIESTEYIRMSDFGLNGITFDKVSYEVDFTKIARFFEFHQTPPEILANINIVQFAAKLRAFRISHVERTQGIPSETHRRICKWISKNRRVWQWLNGPAELGAYFDFDPADLGPGALAVYASERSLENGVSPGLVLRSMVSRGPQQRGLIHEGRILETTTEKLPAVDTQAISSTLRIDRFFNKYGITQISDIAEVMQRSTGMNPTLFGTKQLVAVIQQRLPADVEDIGLGIIANRALFEDVLRAVPNRRALRRTILESLIDRFGGDGSILIEAKPPIRRLLARVSSRS